MSIGIPCPECQHGHTKVTDSRPRVANGEGAIYRRRDCLACGHRFTTIESRRYVVDMDPWPLLDRIMGLPKERYETIVGLVEMLA